MMNRAGPEKETTPVSLYLAVSRFLSDISHRVLLRGYDYFNAGRISVVMSENNIWTFSVYGNQDYLVTLSLRNRNGKPGLTAACSCPAAKPCKHQVACALVLQKQAEESAELTADEKMKLLSSSSAQTAHARFKKTPAELAEQVRKIRRLRKLKKNDQVRQVVRDPDFILEVAVNQNTGQMKIRQPEDFESLERIINKKNLLSILGFSYSFMKISDLGSQSIISELVVNLCEVLPRDSVRFTDQKNRKLRFAGFITPALWAELDTSQNYTGKKDEAAFSQTIPIGGDHSFHRVPDEFTSNFKEAKVVFIPHVHDELTGRNLLVSGFPFYIPDAENGAREIYLIQSADKDLDRIVRYGNRIPVKKFLNMYSARNDGSVLNMLPEPYRFGPYPEAELFLDKSSENEPVIILRKYIVYYKFDPLTKTKDEIKDKNYSDLAAIIKEIRESLDGADQDYSKFRMDGPPPVQYGKNYHLDGHDCLILRDFSKEAEIINRIWNIYRNLRISRSWERRITGNRVKKFMLEEVPALIDAGFEVRAEADVLEFAQRRMIRPVVEISEGSGIEWFSGRIKIPGLSDEDVEEAIKAYRKGTEFFRARNEKWISLKDLDMKKVIEALEHSGIHLKKDGTFSDVSLGSVFSLKTELSEERLKDETKDKKIQFLSLAGESGREFIPAKGFKAELRPYQKEGAAFLLRRHETGIGGILADDMGLGKTVQTLAFMHYVFHNSAEKPLFLAIVPTAALGVWENESRRFAGDFPVKVYHGTDRKTEPLPENGLLLTTFGILQRDSEELRRIHFESIFVDEAQYAKNHNSQSARSLIRLKAKSYFCLTGTPLENHLRDLWTLLNFVFPGYAGDRKAFLRRYRTPDDEDMEALRRKLSPVLLRRRRHEVLTELPPRVTEDIMVSMTAHQSLVYESVRTEAVEALKKAGRDYLWIMLPYLTRLRRIACHPDFTEIKLVRTMKQDNNSIPEHSGKFIWFKEEKEKIESAADGILVFSQYTDILDMTEKILKETETEYFRIDGSTRAEKRTEYVKRFQNGEGKYFLISLKAGGSALTLHRADTVIHLDPWWNPAVEEQATARAHRMGQKRNVMVYRCISQGSIEEKVIKLQNRKRKLFSEILDHPEAAQPAQFTREELEELLN